MNIDAGEPPRVPSAPSEIPGWGLACRPTMQSRLHPALDMVIIWPLENSSCRAPPDQFRTLSEPSQTAAGTVQMLNRKDPTSLC
jgi:hypothetical protein